MRNSMHCIPPSASRSAGLVFALLSLLHATHGNAANAPAATAPPNARAVAQQWVASCTAPDPGKKLDCIHIRLKEHVRQQGAPSALDVVVELAKLDRNLSHESHMFVHMVGQEAYAVSGNPTQAFLGCRDTFGSGCYHGVLQMHLKRLGNLTDQAVRDVCHKTIDTQSSEFLRYQCLHGVGHGLMLHFERDVELSLKNCDALETDRDRESCYGGVFMENFGATHGHHAPGGDTAQAHGHDHGGHSGPAKKPRVSGLRADDLHYPCSAVDDKYKRACYFLQTSAVFKLVGQDYIKVFKTCDQAPKQHIETCYRSLGRDISGYTLNDPKKVSELCMLGSEPYIGYCYIGAVQDFVNNTASPDTGMTLCATLPNEYKRDCYTGIGEMLIALFPDKERRATQCEASEARYVPVCKAAARLY